MECIFEAESSEDVNSCRWNNWRDFRAPFKMLFCKVTKLTERSMCIIIFVTLHCFVRSSLCFDLSLYIDLWVHCKWIKVVKVTCSSCIESSSQQIVSSPISCSLTKPYRSFLLLLLCDVVPITGEYIKTTHAVFAVIVQSQQQWFVKMKKSPFLLLQHCFVVLI